MNADRTLLNNDTTVQVSDTTKLNSFEKAGAIIAHSSLTEIHINYQMPKAEFLIDILLERVEDLLG